MNVLQAILKLLGNSADAKNVAALKNILQLVRAKLPDLAPQIDPIIAALDAPITPEGLTALAGALPPELLNIAQLKFHPKPHAGDAI